METFEQLMWLFLSVFLASAFVFMHFAFL